MPQSKVAERLQIHARLCRQMAAASLDENVADKLRRMAEECIEAPATNIPTESLKAARCR
jgi:hypothetical protein